MSYTPTVLLASVLLVVAVMGMGCAATTTTEAHGVSQPPEAVHASYEDPYRDLEARDSRSHDPGAVEFFPAVD